jgi:hypothetical protein
MTTIYLWQHAPFTDRVNVYDNYVYTAQRRGDDTIYDFEEFDQFYYNCSFWSVAHLFGV